jgi:hypothetical protein
MASSETGKVKLSKSKSCGRLSTASSTSSGSSQINQNSPMRKSTRQKQSGSDINLKAKRKYRPKQCCLDDIVFYWLEQCFPKTGELTIYGSSNSFDFGLVQWFLTFFAPWTPKGHKNFHGPLKFLEHCRWTPKSL